MRARKEEAVWLKNWVRPLGFGGIIGALSCLLMLLLLSALLLTQDAPMKGVTPLGLVAAVIGAFVGGFSAGRIAGQNGWLVGLLTGVLLFFLLAAVGGFALFRDPAGTHMLIKLSTMAITAAVGGIVSLNVLRKR